MIRRIAGIIRAISTSERADAMDISWLDFFSGGVPALVYFRIQVDGVKKLVSSPPNETTFNPTAELCIIGLAAYFEAFCKNEFAAVVNICPETLRGFAEKRDCRIVAKNLLNIVSELDHSLGFVVAEEYDFGSPKSINGLFQDLINITPFSTKQAGRYSHFLNDRNLLVHHGGVYTAKYKSQKFIKMGAEERMYFDSLVVRSKDVIQWADFLTMIATKTGEALKTTLLEFVTSNKLTCDPERMKAIEALAMD